MFTFKNASREKKQTESAVREKQCQHFSKRSGTLLILSVYVQVNK